MREHQDFANGNNPPREVNSTAPEFRIVRQQQKRTVLVLDTSGSMGGQRKIEILAQVTVSLDNTITFFSEKLDVFTESGKTNNSFK